MLRSKQTEGRAKGISDATTTLFGLRGLRVIDVTNLDDDTKIVDVVTDDDCACACPGCGVFSTSRKGTAVTRPKDIHYGSDRIMLRWNKSRWRCREDCCERGTFTETIEQIPARARTTGRLRAQIGAAIGDAARSVAEVASSFAVSWPTAHRAFIAHADALLTEPAPVRILGIDETRRGKPRWEWCPVANKWVRVDPWDTGFVDIGGDQGLLGQMEGLQQRTPAFREAVEFVAIDPAQAGAAAECEAGGRSFSSGSARESGGGQVPGAGHMGAQRPQRREGRPRVGEPQAAIDGAGMVVGQEL